MADSTFAEYNPTNLPYSAEAEQAVLGAIIIDNAMFDNVLDHVKSADYFYISLHKLIFTAMQEMMNFGKYNRIAVLRRRRARPTSSI